MKTTTHRETKPTAKEADHDVAEGPGVLPDSREWTVRIPVPATVPTETTYEGPVSERFVAQPLPQIETGSYRALLNKPEPASATAGSGGLLKLAAEKALTSTRRLPSNPSDYSNRFEFLHGLHIALFEQFGLTTSESIDQLAQHLGLEDRVHGDDVHAQMHSVLHSLSRVLPEARIANELLQFLSAPDVPSPPFSGEIRRKALPAWSQADFGHEGAYLSVIRETLGAPGAVDSVDKALQLERRLGVECSLRPTCLGNMLFEIMNSLEARLPIEDIAGALNGALLVPFDPPQKLEPMRIDPNDLPRDDANFEDDDAHRAALLGALRDHPVMARREYVRGLARRLGREHTVRHIARDAQLAELMESMGTTHQCIYELSTVLANPIPPVTEPGLPPRVDASMVPRNPDPTQRPYQLRARLADQLSSSGLLDNIVKVSMFADRIGLGPYIEPMLARRPMLENLLLQLIPDHATPDTQAHLLERIRRALTGDRA